MVTEGVLFLQRPQEEVQTLALGSLQPPGQLQGIQLSLLASMGTSLMCIILVNTHN